jgi:hypothetical protein
MGSQANLKTITINGEQYSPSGEWTLQIGGGSREPRKNLDGTVSYKEVPEVDVWSGNIEDPGGTKLETLRAATSVIVTAYLRNGETRQLTQGIIQNHPETDTDGGEVALEIAGNARAL